MIVGCGAPSDGAGPGAGPSDGGVAPAAGRPTPDPDAVVWALSEAPITLDPARAAIDPGGLQVSAQVYDRLFTLQNDRPFQLAAGIAEDWDVDSTGRTYTFTVREGLVFHDGTPLDAPAVKWNFERWMNPNHPSHHGDFRAWRSMFGGATEDADASGRTPNLVQRVEALDARTVRVTLNAPFSPFLNHLAMVPFGIASPKAVAEQGELYGSDAAHLPVGSGPFKVVEWVKDDGGDVTLTAFEGHHAGPPSSPSLRFLTLADAAERAKAVADGSVHGAELSPSDTISGTVQLDPSIRMIPRPARSNAWLMLNHERPPLGDALVRRAIALAMDRERLAREHFGAAAYGTDQLLVPGTTGYEDALLLREPNVAEAKRLLAEAGLEDGFALNISVPTTPRPYLPDPVGTGKAVAEMLRSIGIEAKVQTDTLRRFLTRRATGRTTAWIIGWELQSPDPDNAWYYHFGPSRLASEGRYDNRLLFDTLLDAQRTVASDIRATSYREAARMVRTDDARVFLAATRSIVIASPRLYGFMPGAMGFDDFLAVSLAQSDGETPTPAADAPTLRTAVPTPDPTLEDDGSEGEPGEAGEGTESDSEDGTDESPSEETLTPADSPTQRTGVMTAAPLATSTEVSP